MHRTTMKLTFIKRLLFAFLFCCFLSPLAKAADLEEVVYLKNGSIIHGIIVEQVPNQSIKIQTKDGNLFVFNMDEIQKITKEAPASYTPSFLSSDDEYGWNTGVRYRGFVGDSFIFDLDGYYEDYQEYIYTSHGVQINPYLYVGAGLGLKYWTYWEEVSIPVFANVRGELHKLFRKNVSPYIDVKIGYNALHNAGFYFSPELGCHFYFGHSKCGLSVGLTYDLQKTNVSDYYYSYYSGYHYYDYSEILSGLGISVAFDF